MQKVFENFVKQTKYVKFSIIMLNKILMIMQNGICFVLDKIEIIFLLNLNLFYFYQTCSFVFINYASIEPFILTRHVSISIQHVCVHSVCLFLFIMFV